MIDYEQKDFYNVDDFREITALLRHPGGCPWDREQTHQSIRRNLLEEAYELAEAIDNNDLHSMQEELGDVLMQVLFHASIEEDLQNFDIDDVADMACKKLIFRHPHVFGEVKADTANEVLTNWDQLKRIEKSQNTYADTLNSVARSLPATWRAEKIQKKAAKANFEWHDLQSAVDKVEEELNEVKTAIQEDNKKHIAEEIGDLLFASVNLARWLGVDPEDALNATNEKFISRFAETEKILDGDMAKHSLEEQLDAYKEAKKRLTRS